MKTVGRGIPGPTVYGQTRGNPGFQNARREVHPSDTGAGCEPVGSVQDADYSAPEVGQTPPDPRDFQGLAGGGIGESFERADGLISQHLREGQGLGHGFPR